MDRPIAYHGGQHTIAFARCNDGTSPAEEFFDGLPASDQRKLMTLFKRLGDHGKIFNTEKFKKEDRGFYAFKSYQIRMPCYFLRERVVVVTHGFTKKCDKMPPSELDRAERILCEDRSCAKD